MRAPVLPLVLLAASCGPTLLREVHAPHPLSGRAMTPEIAIVNPNCVDQTGSREACTSRARVTRASVHEVCTAVTLGENADAPRYVNNTRFALVSSTGKAAGQIRSRRDQHTTLRGIRAHLYDVPGEKGTTGWARRDIPHMYRWTFAIVEVCFANAGVLTPATTYLELRADPPGSQTVDWGFRWRFAP